MTPHQKQFVPLPQQNKSQFNEVSKDASSNGIISIIPEEETAAAAATNMQKQCPSRNKSSKSESISHYQHIFHSLAPDCIRTIFHYYIFPVSYFSDDMDDGDFLREEWEFLALYALSWVFEDCPIHLLKGIFHNCRSEEKPGFYYMVIANLELSDDLYPYLRGIQELSFYNVTGLTGNILPNLRGIKKLSIGRCKFVPSEKQLENLRGIEELDISFCSGIQFTDESCKNLRGIRKLRFGGRGWDQITNTGISNLRGVEELHLVGLPEITADALVNVRGVKILSLTMCTNIELSPKTFSNLRGAKDIDIVYSHPQRITDDCLKQIRGVERFSTNKGQYVTDAGIANLRGISELSILDACEITDEAFVHLRGVRELSLRIFGMKRGSSLSDQAFLNITGVEELNVSKRDLSLVTKKSFACLKNLTYLDARGTIMTSVSKSEWQEVKEATYVQDSGISLKEDGA